PWSIERTAGTAWAGRSSSPTWRTSPRHCSRRWCPRGTNPPRCDQNRSQPEPAGRSEEHTSELQSRFDLVCRLLLEKKKHISRNKTRHGLRWARDIITFNGRCNTGITHAYSIVIVSKPNTFTATGGGFLIIPDPLSD